jgi:L-alanine-DL-glutamate epimerase-like enolase superfamily enzyme
MTGIYPDWDTINIWMDRDPIPNNEFADGTLNIPVKSGLGQTPDWDVTHTHVI